MVGPWWLQRVLQGPQPGRLKHQERAAPGPQLTSASAGHSGKVAGTEQGQTQSWLPSGFQPGLLLPRPWSKKLGRGCVPIPTSVLSAPQESPGQMQVPPGRPCSPLPSGHWPALRCTEGSHCRA